MTEARLVPWIKTLGFWLFPAVAAVIGWLQIYKRFNYPIHPDATYTYLPAARALLEQGITFLLTPESYRVVPLGYLWPALWGAEPHLIRIANGGLWLGCVLFLWHTGLLLGGIRAGLVAVALWSLHPELPQYFATELTEPIFLFGVLGWIYFSARIYLKNETNLTAISLAASTLAITLLSRPVLQLIAPLLIITFTIYLLVLKKRQPVSTQKSTPALKAFTISLLIALIPSGLWLLKNGLTFGLWGLGTGSGAGLYLGTHPLFQGTEPAFLGFDYDANIIPFLAVQDGDHLSIVGDKILRNAAVWQITSLSITDAIAFFTRKIWWWLMHHPAQIDTFGSALRKLRVFELIATIAMAFILIREQTKKIQVKFNNYQEKSKEENFFIALTAVFALMLIQLTPILYNSRYSSALLDPWLIPATAFAISHFTSTIKLDGKLKFDEIQIKISTKNSRNIFGIIALSSAIFLLPSISFKAIKNIESTNIDPMHTGLTVTKVQLGQPTKTYGMTKNGDNSWITNASPAAIQAPVTQNDVEDIKKSEVFNGLWQTDLALTPPKGQHCTGAEISYQTDDEYIHQIKNRRSLIIEIKGNGTTEHFITGANLEMRPQQPGSLRTVVNCPTGTVVEWKGSKFMESRHAWDAFEHLKN